MERSGGRRQEGPLKNAFLIAGPTASGKSALALEIARRTGGTIVNADSMQVYSHLSIITARPGAAEMGAVPHRLYGHVHPGEPYSTRRWLDDVTHLAAGSRLQGGTAIFVGGTGLYFKALVEGFSPMPDIPSEIREAWRRRLREEGAEALHAELASKDPAAAAALAASDGQRIVRALEVFDASDLSILKWQERKTAPLVEIGAGRAVVLEPERTHLHARIEARFDAMIEAGAVEEVKGLRNLDLDPAMPAMKAIGVREIADFLAGRCTLDEAGIRAKAASRQYAKRQMTWFRHQMGRNWLRVPLNDRISARELADRLV